MNTTINAVNLNNVASAANDALQMGTQSNLSFIEQLVIQQEVWADGAFKNSNDLLYELLAQCLASYEAMCATTEEGSKLRGQLNSYIDLKGIALNKKSHTLIKIVKCVFGVNKRRVSAYSLVLRTALQKDIKSRDLANFIRENGGVEEIRLAKNGTVLTVTQKAMVATSAVKLTELAKFESEAIAKQLDAANIGQQIVFVATQLADGKFIVNAVTNSTTAVNATLAAYYTANKKQIVQKVEEDKVVTNDEYLSDAIANAA